MDIRVENNVPGIKVTINKSDDGSFAVLLAEDRKASIGDLPCGSVVKLGNREFVILEHSKDTTAVITKDFAKSMCFGEDGNYINSKVRSYCNDAFYKELSGAVGAENIIPHTITLVADDGTGKSVSCKDNISILTTELYRRYREYLPAFGNWWWLATRVSHDVSDYARGVCYVDSDGVLGWSGCDCSRGVRPFCILKSSTLVS